MTVLPESPVAIVVDDDPDILDMVGELLDQFGLRAVPVTEPDTVLELAASRRPALIVLDIMMPGVDGYTVATRLRGDPRTAGIPIVFMTGQDAPIYRTLSFGVGAVAHVQKPFTATTLRAAVGRALGA